MAGTAKNHKPSFKLDQENSDAETYPYLKPANNTNGRKGGGRPLSSYFSPEYQEDYPLTSKRILENYPFFGVLLKEEDGIFKRKEVITKENPKTIEEVEEDYGTGVYQLRLQAKEGGEETLDFTVKGKKNFQNKNTETQTQVINQKFIADLRKELKQEIRLDYQDTITRLEKRNQAKEDELNELSGKVRRLNMELAETERTAAKSVREETRESEAKIDSLKEEIQELKFENFELEQELKYADRDEPFDWKQSLQEAMKNPDVMKMLQPILAKIFGGQPIQQQPPAALGSSPQSYSGSPESHDTQADPQATRENPDPSETNQEPSQQQTMQEHLQQFMAAVIQRLANALTEDNPNKEAINTFVTQQLKVLNQKGVSPPAGTWVSISKTLIDYALQQGIAAEKAAEVIAPMLENLGAAKKVLRYTPAKAAANMLIEQFSIDVKKEDQKEFLVSILDVFKSKLKQPDAANA